MAVLSYNEILPKKVILWNDEPFEVLSAHVFRKQQRKPVNQTKIKSLRTGRVVEQTYHQNENVEEADIEYKQIEYIYEAKGDFWFNTPGVASERFLLKGEIVGDQMKYVKPKTEVEAMLFNDEIIGIHLPIKVDLKVTEAAPAVKGNTVSGGTKLVTLETGATCNVPMFINEGDVLRINTETGEYAERVNKA
jgi:elongation factor P